MIALKLLNDLGVLMKVGLEATEIKVHSHLNF